MKRFGPPPKKPIRAETFPVYTGWGIGVFDFDNDGSRDVFFANGHVMDNIEESQPHLRYQQQPLLLSYRDGSFVDISSQGGTIFKRAWASRGAAIGDLDNDGDLDIVVANVDEAAYFAKNQSQERLKNNWIGLQFRGCAGNRDGIGARVVLTAADGTTQHAMAKRAGSYLSSNDGRVFFGLGRMDEVKAVEIDWPGGTRQSLSNPELNQIPKPRSGARPAGQRTARRGRHGKRNSRTSRSGPLGSEPCRRPLAARFGAPSNRGSKERDH